MQNIEGRSSYHGQTQQEGTRTRGSDLVPAEQNGLFKYRKGGKGALLKCFIERIVENHTDKPCTCPGCGQTFARETLIRGTPKQRQDSHEPKAISTLPDADTE